MAAVWEHLSDLSIKKTFVTNNYEAKWRQEGRTFYNFMHATGKRRLNLCNFSIDSCSGNGSSLMYVLALAKWTKRYMDPTADTICGRSRNFKIELIMIRSLTLDIMTINDLWLRISRCVILKQLPLQVWSSSGCLYSGALARIKVDLVFLTFDFFGLFL